MVAVSTVRVSGWINHNLRSQSIHLLTQMVLTQVTHSANLSPHAGIRNIASASSRNKMSRYRT